LALSAEAFFNLNDRFGNLTKAWLKADQMAQRTRWTNPDAMDIYDTAKEEGMSLWLSIMIKVNILSSPIIFKDTARAHVR
jgi:hypothetical protein